MLQPEMLDENNILTTAFLIKSVFERYVSDDNFDYSQLDIIRESISISAGLNEEVISHIEKDIASLISDVIGDTGAGTIFEIGPPKFFIQTLNSLDRTYLHGMLAVQICILPYLVIDTGTFEYLYKNHTHLKDMVATNLKYIDMYKSITRH